MTMTAAKSRRNSESGGTGSTGASAASLPAKLWVLVTLITVSTFLGSTAIANSLPDFQSLVAKNGKTVVKISVTAESKGMDLGQHMPDFDSEQIPDFLRKFFEQMPNMPQQPRQSQGFGSGFIISDDGYIVTNTHVVEDATEIRVSMQDRTSFKAELIGSDKRSDIALLKIDAEDLPVAELGDSDEVQVGQWVLAIGSPFGFEYTATQGIVSAVARSLPDDTYVPFIQTDVAVNPGNSGGPLYDTEGRVIGVNSQIYSRSGGYMGLSFAIPINVAKDIINQLKSKGYASRGWLGVMIQNVDQTLAESFGLKKPEGALIAQVTPESPAEESDLRVGDIILKFNGITISRSSDLPPAVGSTPVNSTVPVVVMRSGKKSTLDVTIGELEEIDGETRNANLPTSDNSGIGATVQALTAEQKKESGIADGVIILEVDPDGASAVAGIQAGDILVSFNRQSVTSVTQLKELINSAPLDQAFPVLIQRNGNPAFMAMTLGNR